MADERFKDFIIENGRGHDIDVFLLPRINKLISCRIGLNYQYRSQNSYLDHTVSEFYNNEGEILKLQSNASLAHVLIPFHLILNKRINKLNFYGISGIHFGATARNSFFFERTKFRFINNESIQFKERVNVDKPRKNDIEFGWSIGGGGEFYLKNRHSIFIEVQYGAGLNSFNKNNRSQISHKSITFSIGFNFNRIKNDN